MVTVSLKIFPFAANLLATKCVHWFLLMCVIPERIVTARVIIPQTIIDEVKARTDIVDVVSDYVRLKKRGSNFVGLCPFHTEKTPSFNVNPSRDIFKCFGCGTGGDVFNFVSQTEGLSFPESVRLLADRAGIVLPSEQIPDEEASEVDSIYQTLRFAAGSFFKLLTQSPTAQDAREYLERRGLTGESVKRFGLGFADNTWDGLIKEARKAHISSELLEKAGLIIAKKNRDGHYDRYRNRIIFPITSHVGKVVGFGGRVLDPEDEPKYINSPETKVYNKSRVLYGLFQARNEIRKRDEVLLVEGYTDVIALHQAGLEHAVATCGTAVTVEQIKLLSRYTNRIVLLYDADSAGIRAAFRAIDLILEHGFGASAVSLPPGQDPDSYVRKEGAEAFDSYLKRERQDVVHFILNHARSADKMKTPEDQAGVQRTILRTIGKIQDPLVRESYVKLASEAMDIPDLQLRQVLNELITSDRRKRLRRTRASEQSNRVALRSEGSAGIPNDHRSGYTSNEDSRLRQTSTEDLPGGNLLPVGAINEEVLPAEKTLFGIMLRDGRPLVEFIMSNMSISDFSEGTSREMAEKIVTMYEEGPIIISGFIEGKHGDGLRRLSTEVLTYDIEPSENWLKKKKITVPGLNQEARESAASAMTILKLERIETTIVKNKERMYRAQQNDEDTRNLAEKMMELTQIRKNIQERKFIQRV